MNTRSLILCGVAACLATASMAQVEYDDMYFNSKDRQKLKEKQASEQLAISQSLGARKPNRSEEVYADNSMANYSARNVNPEYSARSYSEKASDDAEYFSSDYRYSNASNYTNFNNSYSNWYNNPWVANNYWGSSIYGWNSPYYGSYYDSWGNPWMNPYYNSGWSSSFSFYWGNSWNYGWGSNLGWGMGFSYGNPYYNSWAGWGPSMGWGMGMGMGWGRGYYRYPSVVIINNDYGRNYAYGKRGTQNGMVTRNQSVNNTRPSTMPTGGSRPTYNGSNGSTGGRIANQSTMPAPSRGQVQRQDDYYNRNWRTSRQGDNMGGSYSAPSRSSQSNGWNNNSGQSQWNRSSGGFDNGRSGTFNSGGGNTRSSAPASSGSNGRSRGRD